MDFYKNWVVFVLLLAVQTSLPPIACYFNENDAKFIKLSGVILMVIFAVLSSLWRSPWFQYYYSRFIRSNLYRSKPYGVKDFDVDTKEAVWIPERVFRSKPNTLNYIKEIMYDVNDNHEISILGVKLHGFEDVDFDGSQKERENKFAENIEKHLKYTEIDQEIEEELDEEEEKKEDIVDEDQNDDEDDDKDDEEKEETKENIVDEKVRKLGEEIDQKIEKGEEIINNLKNITDFINRHRNTEENQSLQGKSIKFKKNEFCTKVIMFSTKSVDTGDTEKIIGVQFITNVHKSSQNNPNAIGLTHGKNTANGTIIQTHIIDPGTTKTRALAQIACFADDDNQIKGLAFTFAEIFISTPTSNHDHDENTDQLEIMVDNGEDDTNDEEQGTMAKTVDDKKYEHITNIEEEKDDRYAEDEEK